MTWGPASDRSAELLESVCQMRSDIIWLSVHCATERQNCWAHVHMAVEEREFRFVFLVASSAVIGVSGMAAQLCEEAERWLRAEGLHLESSAG